MTNEQDEKWIIPFCIKELEKLNKALEEEYAPSEIQGIPYQEVIYRLTIEMRKQNQVLMMALKALELKNESKNNES